MTGTLRRLRRSRPAAVRLRTSGRATSSAPTRPGTPSTPRTPTNGASPRSPGARGAVAGATSPPRTGCTRSFSCADADGDRCEVVSAIAAVVLAAIWTSGGAASPDRSWPLVTTTVTEAGYRRIPDGGLDTDDPEVASDIAGLREDGADADVVTAPGKLVLGLVVRAPRPARGWPSCPATTCPTTARWPRGCSAAGRSRRPHLAAWIEEHVAFVTTMVDRITPRATGRRPARRADLDRGRRSRAGGHRALHGVGARR